MTDDDVRALLRRLRDEPVPADSLARVRMAVAERSRIGTGIRRFGLPWKFAGTLAAAALIAIVVMISRPIQPTISPRAKVQEAVTASRVSQPPVVNSETKKAARSVPVRRKQKDRPSAIANRDGLVVRIETTDPDVVILLIGD